LRLVLRRVLRLLVGHLLIVLVLGFGGCVVGPAGALGFRRGLLSEHLVVERRELVELAEFAKIGLHQSITLLGLLGLRRSFTLRGLLGLLGLRRVLIGGLEGSAITAVRLSGVNHEYATVPGVREDVLDRLFARFCVGK
jgi:hypothetical protein